MTAGPDDPGRSRRWPVWLGLAMALAVAAGLRFHALGRLSYWYDEVVTIQIARTANPRELLELLGQIDATRAPLHPLLLQAWVRVLGPSEASSRAFSAACGVLAVAWIFRLARRSFASDSAGLWASWLAALSPLLVLYSRETRMYSWLVLVTCASWDALISLGSPRAPGASNGPDALPSRPVPSLARQGLYVLGIITLIYSHPLGLLMSMTLAAASALGSRAYGLTASRWFQIHLAAAIGVLPWLKNYLDHPPEMVVGRLPLRFLFGTPIGFIGGNFLTFAPVLALGALGALSMRRQPGRWWPRVFARSPVATRPFLVWLIIPPTLLWTYSFLSHPIFGPARYTLFVAPAFLILVGRGVSILPRWLGVVAGLGLTWLAVGMLPGLVFAPDAKSDWRGAAAALAIRDPSLADPVIVVSNDPARNLEIVTARYYLDAKRPTLAYPAPERDLSALRRSHPENVWLAIGIRHGWLTVEPPPALYPRRDAPTLDLDGLRLIRVDPNILP